MKQSVYGGYQRFVSGGFAEDLVGSSGAGEAGGELWALVHSTRGQGRLTTGMAVQDIRIPLSTRNLIFNR